MRGDKEATWVALLNDEGKLLRIMKISDEVLGTVAFKTESRDVDTTLAQRVLVIPELDFEKPIPKGTARIVPFAVEGKGAKRRIVEVGAE